MNRNNDSDRPSNGAEVTPRLREWVAPSIQDADIKELTAGGGTSGIEGSPFLKTGS